MDILPSASDTLSEIKSVRELGQIRICIVESLNSFIIKFVTSSTKYNCALLCFTRH